jgi:hypothetical protein
VLLEDAVGRQDLPSRHVCVVAEDAAARHIAPRYPTIPSRDLVRMIFEADSVVAL